MIFIVILILTALSLAGTAAFFSIYGLAAIFSGIFWPVVIMGTVLEVGKLVAISYLYRFRETVSLVVKVYLYSAVLILMLITSAGIFGFLSMGYQQDILPLKQQEQQIMLLQAEQLEISGFKDERLSRRKQIDDDVASLPNNFVKGRQRLLKTYGPELEQLRNDISGYTAQLNKKTLQLSELKQQKLLTEVHIGPIIFLAAAINSDTNDATKWIILLLIFVFDPLAVFLTVAANHALVVGHKRQKAPQTAADVEKNGYLNIPPINQQDSETPSTNVSIDDLKSALEEMNNKTLSHAEMAQRGMLEELLERKLVTAKIRNPDLFKMID